MYSLHSQNFLESIVLNNCFVIISYLWIRKMILSYSVFLVPKISYVMHINQGHINFAQKSVYRARKRFEGVKEQCQKGPA